LGTIIASAIPIILYTTNNPTSPPTQSPTYSPTIPTFIPTHHPTPTPTSYPTLSPTITYIEPAPSYSPTKPVKKTDTLVEVTPYILAGIVTTVVVGGGGGAFYQYRKNRRQPILPHVELSDPEQQNVSPSPVAQGPKITSV